MALTMDQLKKLADGMELHYFVDPRRDAIMLGARGANGSYQVVFLLDMGGTFLQLRTIDNLHCPDSHPHVLEVLKVLGAVNYRDRLIKFGWDPKDGEIVAYADMWIQDGTVTQDQFRQTVQTFFTALDMAHRRIRETLETGKDPGEEDPEALVRRMLDQIGGSIPPELASLLAKMRGGPQGGAGPDVSEV